jgi:hypothetical protein
VVPSVVDRSGFDRARMRELNAGATRTKITG